MRFSSCLASLHLEAISDRLLPFANGSLGSFSDSRDGQETADSVEKVGLLSIYNARPAKAGWLESAPLRA